MVRAGLVLDLIQSALGDVVLFQTFDASEHLLEDFLSRLVSTFFLLIKLAITVLDTEVGIAALEGGGLEAECWLLRHRRLEHQGGRVEMVQDVEALHRYRLC